MKKISFLLSCIILFCAFNNTFAQGTAAGLKISSLGLGIELKQSFSNQFGARAGFNYFKYTYEGTGGDVDYDYDLNLSNITAVLDWHPFEGSFRLSGGLLINNNSVDADAEATATYTIGDETYTATDLGTLTGKIEFNKVSPYFSFGWDTSADMDKGLGFIAELGIVLQGSPTVDLEADGPIKTNPIFQDNLIKEEQELQDDVNNFKYYPVVVVGLIYKF